MSPPSRRLGLLGGTFDPPHIGHLIAAEVARVSLQLDTVHFVVAGAPWMKDECSAAETRAVMVELAVGDDPNFEVNRTELGRDGPTYTIDTLRVLRRQDPHADLHFLLGADAAARLPDWKQGDECLELATFVALTRPGYELDLSGPLLDEVRRLAIPAVDVSSTDLRRRFRRGEAVRYQVPRAVERFVREHDLYGDAPTGTGPDG